jgi:hypothetical protein
MELFEGLVDKYSQINVIEMNDYIPQILEKPKKYKVDDKSNYYKDLGDSIDFIANKLSYLSGLSN